MPKERIIKLGFIIVVLLALLMQYSSLSSIVENKMLDTQFRFLRSNFQKPVEKDVVIVGIDEQTFDTYREPLALWHPYLGKFFEAMTLAKPAVVGLDLVLPDRSYDFLIKGHDKKLLAGLLKLKAEVPIVLGQTINEKGKLRALFAPLISLLGPDALGLVIVQNDPDGTIRRFNTSVRFGDHIIPTLATSMAKKMGSVTGDGYIDYSLGTSFTYIPLQQVNAWLEVNDTTELKSQFKNRPVLIGSILPFSDKHLLSVPIAEWEPNNHKISGVLVHAQILRSILADSVIQKSNPVIIVFLLLVAVLFYWIGHKPKLIVPLFGFFTLSLLIISTLWLWHGVILQVITVILISLLAFSSRMSLEAAFSLFEKRRLSASFGRYVSPNVLDEILAGNISPEMIGERRKLCVLFSDIRSFTTRSESQPPEQIISLLNEYFDEMTAAVHSHGGTVDKFIGDGLMVFFGAPNQLDNPAQRAFSAAQEMLQRLETLNKKLKQEDIEEIQIGIGIHYGDVVVGHVGSESRHEYTVIGDTVNLAARLEGRTKELGYPIICTASVSKGLDSTIQLIALGKTPIKGRAEVEVFGWRPDNNGGSNDDVE